MAVNFQCLPPSPAFYNPSQLTPQPPSQEELAALETFGGAEESRAKQILTQLMFLPPPKPKPIDDGDDEDAAPNDPWAGVAGFGNIR